MKKFICESGWPVWADICSGLRFDDRECIVHHFDSLLIAKEQKYQPDTILHIGGPLVSKRFLQFVESYPPSSYIVVKDSSKRYDPTHNVTHHIQYSISHFCEKILKDQICKINFSWMSFWVQNQKKLQNIYEIFFNEKSQLNELAVVSSLSKFLKNGLFIGNSLSIRLFDMYAQKNKEKLKIAANRGVSGIEGNIATALGFAQGLQMPVTIILGDISLLHDLNSITLIKESEIPLYVIVLNNHGGSIFSHLPIAQFDICEKYFTMPHSYNFEKICNMCSLDYYKPQSNLDVIDTYKKIIIQKKSCLIEIQTDKNYNLELQKKWQQLCERLVL